MPPHQIDLTSETLRESAGLGLDFARPQDVMGDALAAAPPDTSIAALRDALSEKDAAGPPGSSTSIVLGLLVWSWRAFQDSRRRRRSRVLLRDLGERELMDIGLTPGDVDHILGLRAIERLRDSTTYPWLSRGLM